MINMIRQAQNRLNETSGDTPSWMNPSWANTGTATPTMPAQAPGLPTGQRTAQWSMAGQDPYMLGTTNQRTGLMSNGKMAPVSQQTWQTALGQLFNQDYNAANAMGGGDSGSSGFWGEGITQDMLKPYTFDWEALTGGGGGNLRAYKDGKEVGMWNQAQSRPGRDLATAALGAASLFGLAGLGPLASLQSMLLGTQATPGVGAVASTAPAAIQQPGVGAVASTAPAATTAAGTTTATASALPEALDAVQRVIVSAQAPKAAALSLPEILGGLGVLGAGAASSTLLNDAQLLSDWGPGESPGSLDGGPDYSYDPVPGPNSGGAETWNSLPPPPPIQPPAMPDIPIPDVSGPFTPSIPPVPPVVPGQTPNGNLDFLNKIPAPLRSLVTSLLGANGGNSLLGNLAGMYAADRAKDDIKGLESLFTGMYGQDSPYAQALRQQLDRRDAAAGRRSQYGPREVELQAKLADQTSRNAMALSNLRLAYGNNRNAMLNNALQGIGIGGGPGGSNSILPFLGSLEDLFHWITKGD